MWRVGGSFVLLDGNLLVREKLLGIEYWTNSLMGQGTCSLAPLFEENIEVKGNDKSILNYKAVIMLGPPPMIRVHIYKGVGDQLNFGNVFCLRATLSF